MKHFNGDIIRKRTFYSRKIVRPIILCITKQNNISKLDAFIYSLSYGKHHILIIGDNRLEPMLTWHKNNIFKNNN